MTLSYERRVEAGAHVRLTRRTFLSLCGGGLAAAGASASGLLAGCGGSVLSEPATPTGALRGTVTDLNGAPQGIGRIYLLLASGLNQNVFADVSATGMFDFGQIPVGSYQLRFWGGNEAQVPEPLPNPMLITIATNAPTLVQFKIVRGAPDETVQEIYAGDYFFQEQPFGDPNALVVVKRGVTVCWYNVGSHEHTVTGGPWSDSGTLGRAQEFEWVANQVGTFPYRCNFHNPLMQAMLQVVP